MLAAERKDLLLDRLEAEGRISTKDLAVEWRLSEDTLRRDLRDLAAAGQCQRVYGGALPSSPALVDYGARTGIEPASKQNVARAAAALIAPGMTVLLDGGTTTLAVARALPPRLACTVITHSPTIATALLDHDRVEVFLLGGRLFKHSAVTCGAAAAEAAAAISADLFLLGVTGVHAEAGLTTGDADEAAMKRTLAGRAAETYVLASAEKLGTASRYAVLPLAEVSAIVTDAPGRGAALSKLRRTGVRIISASA